MLYSSATIPVIRIKEQPQAETATPAPSAAAPEASRASGGDGEIIAAPASPATLPTRRGYAAGKAVFNGFQGPAYPPCLPPDLFD